MRRVPLRSHHRSSFQTLGAAASLLDDEIAAAIDIAASPRFAADLAAVVGRPEPQRASQAS